MSEKERREAAQAALGGDVLAAREVPSKDVLQMLSVRMEPELIGELRVVAESRSMKVSDLLREAAARVVSDFHQQQIHVSTWSNVQVQISPVVVFSRSSGTAFGATYQTA